MTGTHRPALTARDEAFAQFCEQGALALTMAAMLGVSLAPRVHTGYMPADQRRAVAHRAYSDGLRTPPRRSTAADRAKAASAKLFGPRPLLACEVAS